MTPKVREYVQVIQAVLNRMVESERPQLEAMAEGLGTGTRKKMCSKAWDMAVSLGYPEYFDQWDGPEWVGVGVMLRQELTLRRLAVLLKLDDEISVTNFLESLNRPRGEAR